MMKLQNTDDQFTRGSLTPPHGAGAVRLWLLVIAALVYAMILVGGATRLTDSGLSITEWKPVTGAIPPLNAQDWASEFDKYRSETAEYRLQNKGMSLEEFKFIYFWEWGHRLLGRMIGLVFFVPFVAFWALGRTTPALRRRLWVLFGLGGLQGFIGWWMVASGVGDTDLVDVAAYRLMTHFSLALLIICLCVWFWLDLGTQARRRVSNNARRWAIGLLALSALQMMLGALVAGLDAGRDYTDWPLMGGQVVPDVYWRAELGVRNLFENAATAQFNHRITAYVLTGACLYAGWRFAGEAGGGFRWIAVLALAQTVLGVVTLVHAAPLSLGLMHQALGTILLLAALVTAWRCCAPAE